MLLQPSEFPGSVSSGVLSRGKFKIEANGKAFRVLSDTLYQDRIGSIARELSCNAYDSHLAAGKPELPFEIHLPSIMEPFFSVKDYGIGMDEDTVENVFTSLFMSTKDSEANAVGAFGLGSKTPFSYTDSFTVVAVKDGVSRTFTMYTAEDGCPMHVMLAQNETTEPNGVEVIIPVNSSSHRSDFLRAVVNQLHFFPVRPIIKGGDYDFKWHEEPDASQIAINHNGIVVYSGGSPMGAPTGTIAVMGPVGYTINFSLLSERLTSHDKVLNFLRGRNCRFFFNIGDISVTPSRETLSYDTRTYKAFADKLDGFIDIVAKQYKDKVDSIPSILDKVLFINQNANWGREFYTYDLDGTMFVYNYNGMGVITGDSITRYVSKNKFKLPPDVYLTNTTTIDSYVNATRVQWGKTISVSGNINIVIMDVARLARRRAITAKETLNGMTYIVSVGKFGKTEQENADLVKHVYDSFIESGFNVSYLSSYEAKALSADYAFVKAKGYRLKDDCRVCDYRGESFGKTGYSWTKLTDKTEIEPGFYVTAHYGDIQDKNHINDFFRMCALGIVDGDTKDIPLFCFNQKDSERLAGKDGWIHLPTYVTQCKEDLEKLSAPYWSAKVLVDAYNACKLIPSVSKKSTAIFSALGTIDLFDDLDNMVAEATIIMSSYDDDARANLDNGLLISPFLGKTDMIKNAINFAINTYFSKLIFFQSNMLIDNGYNNPDYDKSALDYLLAMNAMFPEYFIKGAVQELCAKINEIVPALALDNDQEIAQNELQIEETNIPQE